MRGMQKEVSKMNIMKCSICESDIIRSYREEQDKRGRPSGTNYCDDCFEQLDQKKKLILKTIQKNPGIKISDLSESIGLPKTQVRNFLKNNDFVYKKPDFQDLRSRLYFIADGVKIE